MVKSLGDHNIEQASSSDLKNIKWTKKNPADPDKPKKKKASKKAPKQSTNIIYTDEYKKPKPSVEKVFKVEIIDTNKPKKKKTDKKSQRSSASNSNIQRDFKRPAR